MSSISVNTITDASGGATTSINGFTPSVSNMAGRNRIINGDMRIDQRNAGASSNFGTGGEFSTVDRWQTFENTGGSATNQQVVDAPAGFYNSLKVTVTSSATPASSEVTQLQQMIEGFNTADLAWGTASAKTVTLSFWAKANTAFTADFDGISNEYVVGIMQYFGTGGTPSSATNTAFTTSIALTTTWTKYTYTATLPSVSGKTVGSNNNDHLRVYLLGLMDDDAGKTVSLAQVQLEIGDTATPFEHRSYGEELALCQRYYWQISQYDGASQYTFITGAVGSADVLCCTNNPQPMRAAPTVVYTGTVNLYTGNSGAVTNPTGFAAYTGTIINRLQWSRNGLTIGQCAWVDIDDAKFTFDAEL